MTGAASRVGTYLHDIPAVADQVAVSRSLADWRPHGKERHVGFSSIGTTRPFSGGEGKLSPCFSHKLADPNATSVP
jgi:hypothetical protein